jgi:hypothetical protein
LVRLAHFPEYFFNLAKSSRASLNKDAARRIAASIAKLPELVR